MSTIVAMLAVTGGCVMKKLSDRLGTTLTLRDGRGRRRAANLGVKRTKQGPLLCSTAIARQAHAGLFGDKTVIAA